MKIDLNIIGLSILLLLAGCGKPEYELSPEPVVPEENTVSVPEGYFVVSFNGFLPESRAGIDKNDTRVQTLRYILYDAAGNYVRERVILNTGGTAVKWPLPVTFRDTLPLGSYRAVFLGNVEKTLFPYANSNATVNYSDVLLNYTAKYTDARIYLPNAEFKDNTEYYWANVTFSNGSNAPYVLLQRIIGMMNVHRNVVDAQTALNKLENNIVTQVGYKNILKTTAQGILTTEVRKIVGNQVPELILLGLGGLDAVVNPVVAALVQPVTDTLYNRLLKGLTNQIGLALSANENQNGLLGVLGELLNPWEFSQAHTAIVDIKDFPKSVDFDLMVKEKYTGVHHFRYDFTSDAFFAQKCLYIKGFSGQFNIRNVNVIKQGLVSGVVFDGIVDGPLLLNGTFVDIRDSLVYTPAVNRRYKADYSFVDLGLTSYQQQTDGNHSLTVSVQLLEIGNINGLLGGLSILNTILNFVLNPIKNITVSTPLNLPLLGVSNLKLSGGWNVSAPY